MAHGKRGRRVEGRKVGAGQLDRGAADADGRVLAIEAATQRLEVLGASAVFVGLVVEDGEQAVAVLEEARDGVRVVKVGGRRDVDLLLLEVLGLVLEEVLEREVVE